jgi:hypothetical protein
MAEKAITLYCAGCEPSLTFYRPFFIPLTLITGGQYIALDEADSLSNVKYLFLFFTTTKVFFL